MDSPSAVDSIFNSSNFSERLTNDISRFAENYPPVIPTAIDEDQKALWRLDDDGGNQWIRYPSPDEV